MKVADTLPAGVRAFVAHQHTLTLATIGPDGRPQAVDLYYAETDELDLYFVSISGSRHATNVARNPRIAATIHANSSGWRDIQGVQLEGVCEQVTGTERAKAWMRYIEKFPFVLADAALARALKKVAMYRITLDWLRWIDNTTGLGHNQEWTLTEAKWQISPRS